MCRIKIDYIDNETINQKKKSFKIQKLIQIRGEIFRKNFLNLYYNKKEVKRRKNLHLKSK